jgi:hypothetical protein
MIADIYDSNAYNGAGCLGLHYESRHLHYSLNPARPIQMNENSSRPTFLSIYLHFYLSIYIFSALNPSPRPELCRPTRALVGKRGGRRVGALKK